MTKSRSLANKRILFFLAGLELGGAERQAIHLARHLQELGCDIRVWANFGQAGPGLASEKLDALGIPWSVQPSCWPCRKRHWPRFIWRVIRTHLALRRERADVILAYCARPCISTGLAWRGSQAKAFIWGQRDCYLPNDRVTRFAYHQASAVVCNAAHEVDFLRETMGESNTPVSVVHNGLDLAPQRKARDQWRTDLQIAPEAPVAVMVANLNAQKDHPTLLCAWRRMLDTISNGSATPRLLLAGADQGSGASIQQLVDQLELQESVTILGQIEDVTGLLAASDIGLLSSPSEGLSNSIIEYMASGLPVVATDIPANREALGDAHPQQCCKPENPADMADRLNALMASPALREELGKRNQRRASQAFSVKAMCEQTVNIIEAALDAL